MGGEIRAIDAEDRCSGEYEDTRLISLTMAVTNGKY